MKLSSETLQILPYFWNKKIQIGLFFVFHFELLWICYGGCEKKISLRHKIHFEQKKSISKSNFSDIVVNLCKNVVHIFVLHNKKKVK